MLNTHLLCKGKYYYTAGHIGARSFVTIKLKADLLVWLTGKTRGQQHCDTSPLKSKWLFSVDAIQFQ